MARVNESMTVNEVLRSWPATADVLNRYALDMCCGGGLTLTQAAAFAGADLQSLLRDLERTTADSAPARECNR